MDYCKKSAVLLLLMLVFVMQLLPVYATDATEFDEYATGSILVDYNYNDDPLDDVTFEIYYVADRTCEEHIEFNDCFCDCAVELSQLNSVEAWIALQQDLEACTEEHLVAVDYEVVTDENGLYLLDDLETGLYFLVAEDAAVDDVLYLSDPIVVMVGQYDYTDEQWLYDVEVTPKISMMSLLEEPDPEEPDDPVDPEEPDDPEEPTLEEEEEEPESEEPDEQLPQTGSIANRIPVFSSIGLVLILLGVLLKTKGKRDES